MLKEAHAVLDRLSEPEDAHHRRRPRPYARRRARDRARLRPQDRRLRRQPRLSRGDAGPASGARRDLPRDRHRRPGRGDDDDADRPVDAGEEGQGDRPRRRRRRGAARARRDRGGGLRRYRRRSRLAEGAGLRPPPGPRLRGEPDAQEDRREGAEAALSRALPADRPVGGAWRRPPRHAGGRDRRLRRADRDRHRAEPRAGVLPARDHARAEAGRQRHPPRPCRRRRRDGRRDRRLGGARGLRRHARRRRTEADRQGDQGRDEDAREDAEGPAEGPRRARPAGAGPARRRHFGRRPRHRGGAREAGAEAQDLRRHRAAAEGRGAARHQHLGAAAARPRREPRRPLALRRPALLQPGVAHAADRDRAPRQDPCPRPRAGRPPSRSTCRACRRRSPRRPASSSTAR